MYPAHELVDEYAARYEGRGSPKPFLDLIRNNWSSFLAELGAQQCCDKIELSKGQFLSNVIDQAKVISEDKWVNQNPKVSPSGPDGKEWTSSLGERTGATRDAAS